MIKRILSSFILLICICIKSSGQHNAIVQSRFIFPPQSQHVHGSSIVALPNGDMLAAWFQGSGERNADDVKIMGARLKKNKTSWSLPFIMADTYNLPDCNPVLFLNSKEKLFLIWIAVQANEWEQSLLRYRTSVDFKNDGPPVWNWQDNILLKPGEDFAKELHSKFKALPPLETGWSAYAPRYDAMILQASKDAAKRSTGWMTRIAPLLLSDGKIILPLYSDGYNLSLMAISDDDGDTWKPGLPVAGRGNVQPSLIQKTDGSIVAYMRDNGDEPNRVQISESKDHGTTWSAAQKTSIPNTASVAVCRLKNGIWVFVGNDIDDGRYRISLYASNDEGNTWKWKMPLEETAKGQGSFSYPSIIQTSDGLVHITYSYKSVSTNGASIKHVTVDADKLMVQ